MRRSPGGSPLLWDNAGSLPEAATAGSLPKQGPSRSIARFSSKSSSKLPLRAAPPAAAFPDLPAVSRGPRSGDVSLCFGFAAFSLPFQEPLYGY